MSESIETTDISIEALDREFTIFEELHDEYWEGLVKKGIPLLQKLSEASDPRAEEVRNTLSYTKMVITNSGAGPDNFRADMLEKLTEALEG